MEAARKRGPRIGQRSHQPTKHKTEHKEAVPIPRRAPGERPARVLQLVLPRAQVLYAECIARLAPVEHAQLVAPVAQVVQSQRGQPIVIRGVEDLLDIPRYGLTLYAPPLSDVAQIDVAVWLERDVDGVEARDRRRQPLCPQLDADAPGGGVWMFLGPAANGGAETVHAGDLEPFETGRVVTVDINREALKISLEGCGLYLHGRGWGRWRVEKATGRKGIAIGWFGLYTYVDIVPGRRRGCWHGSVASCNREENTRGARRSIRRRAGGWTKSLYSSAGTPSYTVPRKNKAATRSTALCARRPPGKLAFQSSEMVPIKTQCGQVGVPVWH
ncbi:hypothetical protein BV25DRAFT_1826216 [Artomyces pyxidatus]|uniref:Uncharacterized protein n=1 Tax=Artomyces pyxidatus TaxID=48021 RepID=A0ACB8T1L6_9AGAM|nr:hypothetical protein BV25DRAFT_1826216 [Artomyces pyxidatus]